MTRTHYFQLFTGMLLALCVNLSVFAQGYEEGRAAYIKGDYQSAYNILRPLADAGNAEAQTMLGIMYDYGQGVTANPQEALQWYVKSAEQGQIAVQFQVGSKYYKGEGISQDYTEAARWWEMAAAGGNVDAQFNLGLMYFRGMGVSQDDARATGLFQQAADQDHAQAQYSLAVMYAFGRSVEKNYATAMQWFLKAADKNVAQAQYNLGMFYENGYGVSVDLVRAKEWYELAAAAGLEEAKSRLAMLASLNDTAIEQPVETVEVASVEKQPTENITASSYSISEISTHGIKREDWLMQQDAKSYTIQIGSVTSEDDIVRFLQSNGIEGNSAYIQVVIDGVTRYNAFYGSFATYPEAEQAVAGLPESLRQVSPWIRNFGILQKMLN